MAEHYNFSHLLPPTYEKIMRGYLEEDFPSYDIGGFVVGDGPATAHLLLKADAYFVGVPFFNAIFQSLNCQIEWLVDEGTFITVSTLPAKRRVIAYVRGACKDILLGERTALNLITRASGVGTIGHRLKQLAQEKQWSGAIAGTRKTTPGFRLVEKYALMVAGVDPHRYDLSQMVMLKDNHVCASGSITQAVRKAKRASGFSIKIEVECQNEEEALEASRVGADIVMLDNFRKETLPAAAKKVKQQCPHVIVEASGGIGEKNITDYFLPEIDVISLGLLTHGYPCIDFSLKIQRKEKGEKE